MGLPARKPKRPGCDLSYALTECEYPLAKRLMVCLWTMKYIEIHLPYPVYGVQTQEQLCNSSKEKSYTIAIVVNLSVGSSDVFQIVAQNVKSSLPVTLSPSCRRESLGIRSS